MATIWNSTELHREEAFARLVAAYDAAARNELWHTLRMIENRLVLMGAWKDDDGRWRTDYANRRDGKLVYRFGARE